MRYINDYIYFRVGSLKVDTEVLDDDIVMKKKLDKRNKRLNFAKYVKDLICSELFAQYAHLSSHALKRKNLSIQRRVKKLQVVPLHLIDNVSRPLKKKILLMNRLIIYINQVKLDCNKYITTINPQDLVNLLKYCNCNNDFMRALVLASPSISSQLVKSSTNPPIAINKNHRNFIYNLIKYISRATYKTSPFSTFTHNCIGIIENDDYLSKSFSSTFSRLNQSIILRSYFNSKQIDIYTINPLIYIEQEKLYVIKRYDINYSGASYNKETLAIVDYGKPIDEIINALMTLDYFKNSDIVATINKHISSSDNRDEIILFLKENNIIVPAIESDIENYEIRNTNHIKDKDVKELYLLAKKYSKLSLKDRLNIHCNNNVKCYSKTYQNIFFEDSYVSDLYTLNKNKYRIALDNLKELQKVSLLFDQNIRMRHLLSHFIKSANKSSDRVNIINLYYQFYNYCKETDLNIILSNIREINELEELRIQLIKLLGSQKVENKSILCLSNEDLQTITGRLSDQYSLIPHSSTYYVQPTSDGKFVLNSITSGFGRSLSRFVNYSHEGLQNIKNKLYEYQESNDFILADIRFSLGSNGNIHPLMTKYWIDYMGLIGGKNSRYRILPGDINVGLCNDTEFVKPIFNRRTVWPVHLGLMSYSWLPNIYRFLTSLTTFDSLTYQLSDISKHLGDYKGVNVKYTPQIQFDRIVISREQWIIDNLSIKEMLKSLCHWDKYLFITDLFTTFNIPDKFFIKPSSKDMINVKKGYDGHKPQFININNKYLFNIFLKVISNYDKEVIIISLYPETNEFIERYKKNVELGIETYGI